MTYCGSIDDAPYLEQRFASLMMAIEFFIRNSLVEGGLNEDEVGRLDDLPSLIGAARKDLGWTVPKHYTARNTVRQWRNAVMHGDDWPEDNSASFRRLLHKWWLFLLRRLFNPPQLLRSGSLSAQRLDVVVGCR